MGKKKGKGKQGGGGDKDEASSKQSQQPQGSQQPQTSQQRHAPQKQEQPRNPVDPQDKQYRQGPQQGSQPPPQQAPPPARGQQRGPAPARSQQQQVPPPGTQQQPTPARGQQQPAPPTAWGKQQGPPPIQSQQQQVPPSGTQQQPPHAWRQQQPAPPTTWGKQQSPPPTESQQQQLPPPGSQPQPPARGQQQPTPPNAGGRQQGPARGQQQQLQQQQRAPVPASSGAMPHPSGSAPIAKGKGRGQQQAGQLSEISGGGDGPKQAGQGRGQPRQQPPGGSGDAPSKISAPPTQEVSKLSLEELPLITVKPGIKGRRIKVEVNHLALNLGKLDFAYHYDVALVPDTPKKFLHGVMEHFRKQHYPTMNPAFDGRKNLYSTRKLCASDFISGEVVYKDSEGRDKPYKVEVKLANQVDLRPLKNYNLSRQTPREALQVVDIVLRCAPAQFLITAGRSFFHKPRNEVLDLGEGMEMYYGFYQSAIRGWKPFLNVDVAHKAFPKGIQVTEALIELFSDRFNRFDRGDLYRPLNNINRAKFEKFIKTLRVIYEIPKQSNSRRVYRVNGIEECARSKTFEMEDNGRVTTITIQHYYERHKGYRLEFPDLPTLWVGSMARKQNPILVPLELCKLEEGQVLNRKMTENQTAEMIRFSATNTDRRKEKIRNGMRQANYNAHPVVREFGFSVSDKFEQLDARVLTPPQLGYIDRPVTPSRGVWRNNRFISTIPINKWTIVFADRRDPRPNDVSKLASTLMDAAKGTGIQFSEPIKPFVCIGDRLASIQSYFRSVKDKYDVIFVLVPNSGQQYSYVKTAAEINVGCLTQCIKMRTMGRANVQTCVNILLKVNAKLNGTNHCLATRPLILNKPCMIMGADVTHPSPDSQHIPSVAAVTASFDPKAFRYNICWRLQPPRAEIIEDLENIVVEQLNYFFKRNNGQKPHRIIFFRDGVSEGQFDQVIRAEIRAIRAACKRMQATDYEPAITFLVVQKRHHTRLFPLNPADSEDKNCNVPAGTCVDHHITHPFLQDFYLVSHASIQGVAKPTKYCTLLDDNNLSNDDIEELTYFLCHMFARCNRSVSYPAPTYYAHLAAARAKVYIENDRLDLSNLKREYEKYVIQDSIRKDKPMFFV